jgi:hypothetical protein
MRGIGRTCIDGIIGGMFMRGMCTGIADICEPE